MTDEERLERKFQQERTEALPPYITREERTIAALEKIANGIDKLNGTMLNIYIGGVG